MSKKRTANFSKTEEELLIELVLRRSSVLENRRTDAAMWREKEEGWKALTEEFNSLASEGPRECKTLQLKYKNMKGIVRKKIAHIMREAKGTGGGPRTAKPLDKVEEKVKNLIFSAEEFPSFYDGDPLASIPVQSNFVNYDTGQPSSPASLWVPIKVEEGVVSLSNTDDDNVNKAPIFDTPLSNGQEIVRQDISLEAKLVMDSKLKASELNEERKKNLRLERINLRLERKKKLLQIQKLKLEINLLSQRITNRRYR
ncbi:Hypothetical protein NTJ_02146 [Nesidiocoris tenuis]|uniref:Regulatory protein zeste n=1 Tax=Nesidiocoris tenuis TaxID=355587 RepID=A0ABN7ADU3_9HEMI|nr:Hypothetical protein NTJ_02146 [Nesidiocoris tenuis]